MSKQATQLINHVRHLISDRQEALLAAIRAADIRLVMAEGKALVDTLRAESKAAELGTFENGRKLIADQIASLIMRQQADDDSAAGSLQFAQTISEEFLSAIINSLFDTLEQPATELVTRHRKQQLLDSSAILAQKRSLSITTTPRQHQILEVMFNAPHSSLSFSDGVLCVGIEQLDNTCVATESVQTCLLEIARLEQLITKLLGDDQAILSIALLAIRNEYIGLIKQDPTIKSVEGLQAKSDDLIRYLHAAIYHQDIRPILLTEHTSIAQYVSHLSAVLIGNATASHDNLRHLKAYWCGHLEELDLYQHTPEVDLCEIKARTFTSSPGSPKGVRPATPAGTLTLFGRGLRDAWDSKVTVLKATATDKMRTQRALWIKAGGLQAVLAEAIDHTTITALTRASLDAGADYVARFADNALKGDHASKHEQALTDAYVPESEWGETLLNVFGPGLIMEADNSKTPHLFVISPPPAALLSQGLDDNETREAALAFCHSLEAAKKELLNGVGLRGQIKLFQLKTCVKHLLLHVMISPADEDCLNKANAALYRAIRELETIDSLDSDLPILRGLTGHLSEFVSCMVSGNDPRLQLASQLDRVTRRIAVMRALPREKKTQLMTAEYLAAAKLLVSLRRQLQELESLPSRALQALPALLHPRYVLPNRINKWLNGLGAGLALLGVGAGIGSAITGVFFVSTISWAMPMLASTLAILAVGLLSVAAILLIKNNFKHTSNARSKYSGINKRLAEIATLQEKKGLIHKAPGSKTDASTLTGEGLLDNPYAALANKASKHRGLLGPSYTATTKHLVKQIKSGLLDGATGDGDRDYAKELLYQFARIALANDTPLPVTGTESATSLPHETAQQFVEEASTLPDKALCSLIKDVRSAYQNAKREHHRQEALRHAQDRRSQDGIL